MPQFADLHCHPAIRPLVNESPTMWEAYSYKPGKKRKLRKVLEAQLKGKRGSVYDQSGMPKLQNGGMRLAFAALYPLEKGFLLKKHLVQTNPMPGTRIRNVVNENRAVLLRLFTKFPLRTLDKLAQEEYWTTAMREYKLYLNENDRAKAIAAGSSQEVQALISDPAFRLDDLITYQPQGTYILADKNNPPSAIPDGKVITLLTIEGMGVIAQGAHENGQMFPPRVLDENLILERIKFLKKRTPVFFITYCHHFDNGLCGHARSMPIKSKILGLDQEDRIYKGFNELGSKLLRHLLAVKKNANGHWTDDPQAGRRIYIDLKHMSLAGREEVMELVANYNQNNPGKIPLIASHNGYAGIDLAEMRARVADNASDEKREKDKTQVFSRPTPHFTRRLRFNSWSINLATEEIAAIVESDGLIGLSLEQNILGVKFGDKLKDWKREDFTHLIVSQLCVMAEISGTPNFWKHVAIGSDYDGLINPVDGYPAALFLARLREDVIDMMADLPDDARVDFFLPPRSRGRDVIVSIVDDFCIGNAQRFVDKYFKAEEMPELGSTLA